jgi:hypothetical protein
MLRVEVGALGAHQVKNMRGVAGRARMCKAPVRVGVGISARPGWASHCFLIGYSSCVFVVVGFLVSLVSQIGCFQPGAGVFLALELEGLSVVILMSPACRVNSIAVLIQP